MSGCPWLFHGCHKTTRTCLPIMGVSLLQAPDSFHFINATTQKPRIGCHHWPFLNAKIKKRGRPFGKQTGRVCRWLNEHVFINSQQSERLRTVNTTGPRKTKKIVPLSNMFELHLLRKILRNIFLQPNKVMAKVSKRHTFRRHVSGQFWQLSALMHDGKDTAASFVTKKTKTKRSHKVITLLPKTFANQSENRDCKEINNSLFPDRNTQRQQQSFLLIHIMNNEDKREEQEDYSKKRSNNKTVQLTGRMCW